MADQNPGARAGPEAGETLAWPLNFQKQLPASQQEPSGPRPQSGTEALLRGVGWGRRGLDEEGTPAPGTERPPEVPCEHPGRL